MDVILYILAFAVVIIAQININVTYGKYKKVRSNSGLTGFDVARRILDYNGLNDLYIVKTNGDLTDHYDPTRKVIRLSNHIFNESSIASVSVAAHECGHAIQDKEGYFLFKLRSALVPVVNFVTYVGYIGLIVSLFASIDTYITICLGILVATLVFQLVTLPVEIDASRKGLHYLQELGLISSDEVNDSKKMLTAAALTYVAALLSTLLDVLRIVMMFNRRRD